MNQLFAAFILAVIVCQKLYKNIKFELIQYIQFTRSLIAKIPKTILASALFILLLYGYTMKYFAYKELFLIDLSFFTRESMELKIWDALFVYTNFIMNKGAYLIPLCVILILFLVTSPLYLLNVFIKENLNFFIRIITCVLFYVAIVFALMIFYGLSSSFVSDIKINYISKNPYCDIVQKKGNVDQLVIVEEKSVPYQLIFTESAVLYRKPNESIFTWKQYSPNDKESMNEYCTKSSSHK